MKNLDDYFQWELKDKINYWDELHSTTSDAYEGKLILSFAKKVVFDSNEKIYCKRRAMQELLVSFYKGKIHIRKMITLLIDDWDEEQESSLECLRLKYLSLFIQKDKDDIKSVLIEKTNSKFYEIKSEANYQLGLIKLFESNDLLLIEEYKRNIKMAEELFETAELNEENRIDAEILKLICKYLLDSITSNSESADKLYRKILSLIWEKRLFTFNEQTNPIFIGISRCISKLQMIKYSTPEYWVDYKKEFNNLCLQFYELKNIEYKDNPFNDKIVKDISDNLIKNVVEPIFKYNYKSTISKIDVLISMDDISEREKEFLTYMKQVIVNEVVIEQDNNFNLIRQIYPMIQEEDLKTFNLKIHESNKSAAIYELLKSTKRYSYDGLLNSLVYALVKLQGNHLYRTALEDDRNGYIKDILQTIGYSIKDQTRWGISNTGKSAGEVDMFVENDNYPYSIIEALNLTSLDARYLNLHIDKIFNYDTTGLPYNFIINYVTVKDFATFWVKYKTHISEHTYQYMLDAIDYEIDNEFDYAGIKIALTKHDRDGVTVGLYHICLKISE